MADPDPCPFCGSLHVVPGRVNASEGYGFKPYQTQSLAFTFRNVFAFDFGPAASFCPRCSMVWSKADSKDAAKFIQEFGTQALKTQVAAAQQTHPLP
ncbi:MAG: hypothetical protein ACREIC_28920, partial [Limisphaerales bacterium]